MNTEFDFDNLVSAEIPVKVAGSSYTLKEASGKAAGTYRNACMAAITIGPTGKATAMKNLADVEPLLVSLCLFDENGRNVPLSTITAWPARIQKALFNKAKEISELEEVSDEKKLLEKALALPGAPVDLVNFRAFIGTLPEEYRALKTWAKPGAEELAKNEQSDMTNGSN